MVMEWWFCSSELVKTAVIPMVAVECTEVIVTTISKAAMTNGMNSLVFVVYYNALASFLFIPFVLYRRRASLTTSLLCKFFILSLIGSSVQMLSYTGIRYSSPTLASAILNLVPIFTYLLAVIFRMEDPNLKSMAGLAKLFGAIVAVLGAITVTFYKGHEIFKVSSSLKTLHQLFHVLEKSDWAIGGLILAIKSLFLAILGIYETTILEVYPEKMVMLFFHSCFVTIVSGSFTLTMERNPEAWKLKPDIGLIAIICSAVFSCLFRDGVHAWCYHKKGPVYVAMFKPLGIAIAVFLGILFLGDPLYLGSVIGAIIITIGFYAVIWGKAQEKSQLPEKGKCCLESSQERTPLLQNCDRA